MVVLKNMNTLCHFKNDCSFLDPLIQSKQPDVDDDGMSLDIITQELATRRSKRKSCTGVSYAEPGLRK